MRQGTVLCDQCDNATDGPSPPAKEQQISSLLIITDKQNVGESIFLNWVIHHRQIVVLSVARKPYADHSSNIKIYKRKMGNTQEKLEG